jgi:parallel beta-helix repeat protein
MGYQTALTTFAKTAALTILVVGPVFGCGDAKSSGGGGKDDTASSNTVSGENVAKDLEQMCDGGTTAPDPPKDPPTDCGVGVTAACRVTSGLTFDRFTSLQAAINAAFDGDVLTVSGRCSSAIVDGRTNLTIQGTMTSAGCGFNGPSPTGTRGVVFGGLEIANSTNILIRGLNLVRSQGDGVSIDNSVTPIVTCNCFAFNFDAGLQMNGVTAAVVSQNLSEQNLIGLESNGTQTVIIANNTVTANRRTGILVQGSDGNNVSSNIVTGNGGDGILFLDSTFGLASANTIRRNGDGRTDRVVCTNSQVFGNNAGADCSGI